LKQAESKQKVRKSQLKSQLKRQPLHEQRLGNQKVTWAGEVLHHLLMAARNIMQMSPNQSNQDAQPH